MEREKLEDIAQNFIGDNHLLGWKLMQETAIFYEELCIPGRNTMPDDEIMKSKELDAAAALWAQINSVQGQAEKGTAGHHDLADAVAVTLVATAHVLKKKSPKDEFFQRFTESTGYSPGDFIEKFWEQRSS